MSGNSWDDTVYPQTFVMQAINVITHFTEHAFACQNNQWRLLDLKAKQLKADYLMNAINLAAVFMI